METKPIPPYLGVAYYPEDWDESEQEYDIAKMQEAGITVARIGEFAWHKMEPRPGEYDFAWLHRVIDRLAEAGIAVVLGTPTATPPRWLISLHPDVTVENEAGHKISHGGRRHCCSNNPHYREYSARIVEAMAREFGEDENVIGWQIDNEIYIYGTRGCFCPACRDRFHAYLERKYSTVEALNAAWNLNLFSQAYDSFAEIPLPRDTWHNPHLRMEWLTAQAADHVDFVHMQADILHRYTSAPVSTDIMPLGAFDYREMHEKLDIVQFNHYNDPHNLWQASFWFDALRPMLPRPFWNTETQTCWNGGVEISQSLKPEGYCRVNSFLPIALGGEANMYWLWRTHWAGHELTHGAVLDTSGRPMHIWGEVRDTAELMARAGDFLRETRVKSEVAFHYTARNWNMMDTQPIVTGLDYFRAYDFFRPLADQGLSPDVIDAKEPLDRYRLIVSPLMMTLEEGDLPERMAEWVRAGGVWVVGPLSDIRTNVGTRYQHQPFGMLETLTGAKWCYGMPDRVGAVKAVWAESGESFGGGTWYDAFDEAPENTLVRIENTHSALDGKACVVHRKVGRGHVIILGTFPGYDELKRIFSMACALADQPHDCVDGQLIVAPREGNPYTGDGREGVILLEYSGKEKGVYTFSGRLRNLVTGEIAEGSIELPPYGIAVLERE